MTLFALDSMSGGDYTNYRVSPLSGWIVESSRQISSSDWNNIVSSTGKSGWYILNSDDRYKSMLRRTTTSDSVGVFYTSDGYTVQACLDSYYGTITYSAKLDYGHYTCEEEFRPLITLAK